jgi:SAM-dependent methyltransferase
VISPVYNSNFNEKFIETYVSKDKICLNIGSGNSHVSNDVYNVDIFAYENVDIVCDIEDLPFEDNSIDVILNIAVLEHVPNPQKVMDEIHRVLKPDGIVYTAFPFMQGFHASPYDFTRVTEEGIKVLHQVFEPIEVKPFGGPTSGMLWVLQEWIAILFSFGSKRLHLIIYLLTMVLTFPIKYLDFFLLKHPLAKNISSGFIYIGKKP